MESQSQVPEVPQEPGPSNLRIVRVKRKRNLEAPADLVIQDLAPKKKKPNESLSDALGGLGLSADGGTTSRMRPKRYRKLASMTAAEMLQMGPEKLQKMLTTTQNEEETHPAGVTSNITPLDSKVDPQTTTATATKKRSVNFENSNNSGGERYEQIRRRRGLTNFEVTESAVDPLRGVAIVHDVVRISEETKQQQPSQPSQQQEENQLLCNYLPMVREYLEEEAQKQNSTSTGITDDVMDTDGYVYDLYIEAETQYPFKNTTTSTGNGTTGNDNTNTNGTTVDDEDAWWDMHIRGGAPVVQIIDEDTWLVVEASDEEDTDVSSEDSNAEDYYGNDYPDEEDDSGGGGGFFFSSSDEEGGGGGIREGFGGDGSRRRKEWFDESDESDY